MLYRTLFILTHRISRKIIQINLLENEPRRAKKHRLSISGQVLYLDYHVNSSV